MTPGTTGTEATMRVSGCALGQTGDVTLRLTLSDGMQRDQSLYFLIEAH
jgi:hypothetical protein